MSNIETEYPGRAERTIAYDSTACAIVTNVLTKNEVRVQTGWSKETTRNSASLKMTRAQAALLRDALIAALD